MMTAGLAIGVACANDANKALQGLAKNEQFKESLYKDSEPLRVARRRYPNSPAARAGFIRGYFGGLDFACASVWQDATAEIGLAFKSDLIDKQWKKYWLHKDYQKGDTAGAFFARQFLQKEGRAKWCYQALAVALTLHYEGTGIDSVPTSAKTQ